MWYQMAPNQRIVGWREWREQLSNLSDEAVSTEIASEWGRVPLSKNYLSPDLPEAWPTPWELIHDNIYCELAVALGMFYTAALLPQKLNPQLLIYKDTNGWVNLVSLCSEKYILNWNHGEVLNIKHVSNDMRLVFQYNKSDLSDKF